MALSPQEITHLSHMLRQGWEYIQQVFQILEDEELSLEELCTLLDLNPDDLSVNTIWLRWENIIDHHFVLYWGFGEFARLGCQWVHDFTNLWDSLEDGQCLHPNIAYLTSLTNIELDFTNPQGIPPTFWQLTQITKLSLNGPLQEVPPELQQLTQLTELLLHGCELTSLLDFPWPTLQQLRTLTLSRLKIDQLPPAIMDLPLLSLALHDLSLTILPESIQYCTTLETLDIFNTLITALPNSITTLSNLRQLIISNNSLQEFPQQIGQLSNLESLNLDYNQLPSLPKSIGALSKLKSLTVTNNQITHIPAEFGNLDHLEEFSVQHNPIQWLPSTLQVLDFDPSQWKEMYLQICACRKLKKLSLWNYALTTIPTELTQLTSLTDLELGKNQLTQLSIPLTSFPNLTQLSLRENPLTSLPNTLFQCRQLQELDLHKLPLSSIPTQMNQLSQLSNLDLSDTPLTSLPTELIALTKLKTLDITGTRINKAALKAMLKWPRGLAIYD